MLRFTLKVDFFDMNAYIFLYMITCYHILIIVIKLIHIYFV